MARVSDLLKLIAGGIYTTFKFVGYLRLEVV